MCGLSRSFQVSACSRPPEPRTRIFIAARYTIGTECRLSICGRLPTRYREKRTRRPRGPVVDRPVPRIAGGGALWERAPTLLPGGGDEHFSPPPPPPPAASAQYLLFL